MATNQKPRKTRTRKKKVKKTKTKQKKVKKPKKAKALAPTEEEVNVDDIINETAKLLNLGVSEKDIKRVMEDAGLRKEEVNEILNEAKQSYLYTNVPSEEPPLEYYEPNGWVIILSVIVLILISILIAVWVIG